MKLGLVDLKKKHPVTLIDIIIGIVLIGIIVSASLPKFSNLTIQAREASNDGVVTALTTAISAAHAVWVSSGASNATNGSFIVVDGQQLHVNNFGWPDNNKNVSPEVEDCAALWSTILSNPPIAGCDICVQECTPSSNNGCYITSVTGAICKFALATNPRITITYNMSNGSIGSTSE